MEKIKIPSLPLYNTQDYINYSPIQPNSLKAGQTFINKINGNIMYIPYTNRNDINCIFFDKNGDYIGQDGEMRNAVATFLNNNEWDLTNQEITVINPYNIEQKITLNKQNESLKKYGEVMENVIRRLVKEGLYDDYEEDEEELEPFEEYEKDYPNGDFNVSNMTPEQLAKWCRSIGDFLYVYRGLRGLSIMCANTNSIVYSIVSDLYNCSGIEPTHEVDYLFTSREREFIHDYVCIFKIKGTPDGDYYLVYQQDKMGRNTIDLDENKNRINEAFKSNTLRQWFKEHGGVKKRFEEYDDTVPQDGLGDINDNDILYTEEFEDFNSAATKKFNLKRPSNGRRSDWDMKCYFTIYRANDGTCLLVGLDRKTVPTSHTWGGEVTKKYAGRKWRDDKEPHNKNHYVDDKGTYYYSRKGKDFGMYTNRNLQDLKRNNQRIKSRMSDEEWNDYMDKRVKSMRDYVNRHYPKY